MIRPYVVGADRKARGGHLLIFIIGLATTVQKFWSIFWPKKVQKDARTVKKPKLIFKIFPERYVNDMEKIQTDSNYGTVLSIDSFSCTKMT